MNNAALILDAVLAVIVWAGTIALVLANTWHVKQLEHHRAEMRRLNDERARIVDRDRDESDWWKD